MNIARFLTQSSKLWPDAPAVSLGGETRYTFRSLDDRVKKLAHAMCSELGCQVGDRVAIVMSNHPEYLVIRYAAWYAGLSVVPINAKLHPSEVIYMLENSGASVCFVNSEKDREYSPVSLKASGGCSVIDISELEYSRLYDVSGEFLCVDVDDAHLAWLFYTSGTTGKPKGVKITHANMLVGAMSYFSDVDDVSQRDAIIHAAPLSHGSGFYDLPHLMRGANQVIPKTQAFHPEEIFTLIDRWQGVTMFLAPTMVKRLVDFQEPHSCDLSGLKTIVYGGGPMYLEDISRALEVMGPRFVQIYGQGESPMTITVLRKHVINEVDHPRYEQRLASVGIAQSVVSVRVVNELGRTAHPGERGEVLVKGPVVANGYWENEAATLETWRDGWLYTGDIGFFDQDGFLTLVDRSKDLIISGGSNIYPREVEEVLLTHAAVSEVAVVGRFSQEWGEEVVAFVVTKEHVIAQDLDQFCIEKLARFKRPKDYFFVDVLPKNNYGKVLKTELRGRLSSKN